MCANEPCESNHATSIHDNMSEHTTVEECPSELWFNDNNIMAQSSTIRADNQRQERGADQYDASKWSQVQHRVCLTLDYTHDTFFLFVLF
jgi:hypothetical protein